MDGGYRLPCSCLEPSVDGYDRDHYEAGYRLEANLSDIVLRDARNRIVYSWEVPPPKRELAPGESLSVNEAVTDVPRSARVAEIGWKPE